MKFKFISLIFSIMILSGCVNNNYCHDVYDSQTLICISGIEILDSSRIRVKKDSENCPIYYTNKNGDNIISNELTVSDVISFSDEHYGVSFTIESINQKTITFGVHESWSYPVSGLCTSGELNDTINIKPYGT